MIIIDISEILDKALGISKDIKFNVQWYNKENEHLEFKEMTYLQLGTKLMNEHSKIKVINIIYKEV